MFGQADLAHFFREMQYQLSAGVGVVQALGAMEAQAHPFLRPAIRRLREEVSQGKPLSTAMARFPDVFSPLIISIIRAGEASGKLSDACGNIAGILERDLELRRKLSMWTFYPKLLVVVAIFIIFSFRPLMVGILLGNKYAFYEGLKYIIVGALLFAFYFVLVKLIIPPRVYTKVLDALKSALPGITSLARRYALARFLIALSHLYAAGVSPSEALRLAGESSGNPEIKRKTEEIMRRVSAGERLSNVLDSARILSPSAVNMLRAGEEGGRLPEALEQVAQRLEEEAVVSSHRWVIASSIGFYLFVLLIFGYYILSSYISYYSQLLSNP
ncbi:type II secretion system F family protein [bacterium]|nr:type II secretion system F family protein [bacterium]